MRLALLLNPAVSRDGLLTWKGWSSVKGSLLSKGVNYDRAWDNCSPDHRTKVFYLLGVSKPSRFAMAEEVRRDALLT
jgi:hypothetical protein